jgi:hypothetical protein
MPLFDLNSYAFSFFQFLLFWLKIYHIPFVLYTFIIYLCCMINNYTYSGVNKGCFIASTQISADSDQLEARMKQLHQDYINNSIPLKVLIGEIFSTTASPITLNFGKDSGDRWVLDNLADKDSWIGHIAKIDGAWLCSSNMATIISMFYFNKKYFTTKKEKDYTSTISVLGVMTSYKYTRYMDCVNHIKEINKCTESHAKNLLTKFIKEGSLIKHSHAKSYKVATASDIINVVPEVIISTPTKTTMPVTDNRARYIGIDPNKFDNESNEYTKVGLHVLVINKKKETMYVSEILDLGVSEEDVRSILLLMEKEGHIAISDKYDTIKIFQDED